MSVLTEKTNEDALDVIAEIIEPLSNVLGDEKLRTMKDKKATRAEMVKYAIKNHKADVISILATLNGVKVSEYKANAVQMTFELINLLNDEEIQELFFVQAQSME